MKNKYYFIFSLVIVSFIINSCSSLSTVFQKVNLPNNQEKVTNEENKQETNNDKQKYYDLKSNKETIKLVHRTHSLSNDTNYIKGKEIIDNINYVQSLSKFKNSVTDFKNVINALGAKNNINNSFDIDETLIPKKKSYTKNINNTELLILFLPIFLGLIILLTHKHKNV